MALFLMVLTIGLVLFLGLKVAEAGHAPSRVYTDRNGDLHMNGAKIWDATEVDITATLNGVATAAVAGVAEASKVPVLGAAKDLDALTVVSLTASGVVALTDVASVNAAGTAIGNATALTHTVNSVLGANDAKGVKLPATATGGLTFIFNNQATNGLLIYPPVNSTINGGSANAAINIEGLSLAAFVPTNATNWGSLFTVNA